MNYTAQDLYRAWIEAHSSRESPQGYAPVQESNNYKARFMSPENIQKFLNAGDWWDLYSKPSSTPMETNDYPSMGMNLPQWTETITGKPSDYTFMVSQNPQNTLLNLLWTKINNSQYRDIPQNLQKFIPQAIYEHELAHRVYQPFPTWKNYGYLQRGGMSGQVAGREEPAMAREDRFWDRKRNK